MYDYMAIYKGSEESNLIVRVQKKSGWKNEFSRFFEVVLFYFRFKNSNIDKMSREKKESSN
jgi:hypothetical protein